jgi:quinol monooxygenase YgiN
MILVLGEILTKPDTMLDALALSLEHVHRSREEPGCISHDVAQDTENPQRLMFTERWSDTAALRTHFAVPASRAFVKGLAPLLAAQPSMHVFDASEVKV